MVMMLMRRARASGRRLGGEWPFLEAQDQTGQTQRQDRSRGKFRRIGHRYDDFIAVQLRRAMPVSKGMANAKHRLHGQVRQVDHHDRLGRSDHHKNALTVVVQDRAVVQPTLPRQVNADVDALFTANADSTAAGIGGQDGYTIPLTVDKLGRLGMTQNVVHDKHVCPLLSQCGCGLAPHVLTRRIPGRMCCQTQRGRVACKEAGHGAMSRSQCRGPAINTR
ncbi:hypothetical protein BURMUCGD1_6530 [Burkholderia multivorans CGD1]|nr:hypothetical protein BURMUCGD1_6530 [Burkholderia multivorans CGD1]